MIVAGATAYPRIIDPEPFRAIADEVGALFMFDAAHIAGLIAGGLTPTRSPHADIVTVTTHKTLRGPRGGLRSCRAPSSASSSTRRVFPGLQGGPLDHVIAAKAVCFREAAQPEFKDYAAQIVRNAAGAGRGLARPRPAPGVGRHRQPPDAGRPAHLRRRPVGQEGAPGPRPRRHHPQREHDPRRPAPAVHHAAACASARPAITTQGMHEPEMAEIAALIHRALVGRDDEAEVAAVRDEVRGRSARSSRPTRT